MGLELLVQVGERHRHKHVHATQQVVLGDPIFYCYGIRSERKLCDEVELHLAYRWFCKLDLEDKVPHHSTFSENRLGRFRESNILRHIFERVVWAAMATGLVKGEGFAVDASVMEAMPVAITAWRPVRDQLDRPAKAEARGRRVSRCTRC